MKFAKEAEIILDQEQRQFENWVKSMEVVPTIKNLKIHAESIGKQESDRVISKLKDKLTQKELDLISQMSQKIINKMVHDPIMELKKSATNDKTRNITNETVKRLYKLDNENE